MGEHARLVHLEDELDTAQRQLRTSQATEQVCVKSVSCRRRS